MAALARAPRGYVMGARDPAFDLVLDGTAMYVGLLGQFALQALGIIPDAQMLVVMLATGALAAFGTAPVPSASLFMLAAMLSAVGVSPEQTALANRLAQSIRRLPPETIAALHGLLDATTPQPKPRLRRAARRATP